jgi:thioredoxin 1
MSSEKKVVSINDSDEFDALLKENTLLVVDFFATWCGPCKVIAPKFERLAKEHDGVVKFAKVDVEFVEHAQSEDVSVMPTFKFYKNGDLVQTVLGADYDAVVSAVNELIASNVPRDQ